MIVKKPMPTMKNKLTRKYGRIASMPVKSVKPDVNQYTVTMRLTLMPSEVIIWWDFMIFL
jgi:hypothetical protein